MTPINFAYWLQGLFEIGKVTQLDEEQTQIVKNHLALVFAHSIDTPDPTGKFQEIHDGTTGQPPHGPFFPLTTPIGPSDVRYRC